MLICTILRRNTLRMSLALRVHLVANNNSSSNSSSSSNNMLRESPFLTTRTTADDNNNHSMPKHQLPPTPTTAQQKAIATPSPPTHTPSPLSSPTKTEWAWDLAGRCVVAVLEGEVVLGG